MKAGDLRVVVTPYNCRVVKISVGAGTTLVGLFTALWNTHDAASVRGNAKFGQTYVQIQAGQRLDRLRLAYRDLRRAIARLTAT